MLEQYYFLFLLAFIWTVLAVVQDLKSREVPNWLNFSLVGFALAYRAFYSSLNGNWMFFVYGLLGFSVFFLLALTFYYGRAFGGGDAKLLMGYGAILPFEYFKELGYGSLEFIFILFLIGAAYTLIYSIFLAARNKEKFRKAFFELFKERRNLFAVSCALSAVFLVEFVYLDISLLFLCFMIAFLFAIPVLYVYLKAIEKSCMIKLVKPSSLTEGEWLVDDIKLKGKVIRKSVHGLSLEEINMLKKAGKKVCIREGIPFTPVFLLTLIAMALFFLILKFHWQLFFLF